MEELPEEIRVFLINHPLFQLTGDKKIKCTLNGHELPCDLGELQSYTGGKKYQKLKAAAEFNFSLYEPHLVPSTKQPNRLFCKLSLRHLNREPHQVLKHVSGKRFKKALAEYEECVKQGIEFVPARLRQKKPKHREEDFNREKVSKHSKSMWAPNSSDEGSSDSDDSMSDLYPSSMFTLKNPEEETVEGGGDKEEDDFQTDEDEQMEMETQEVQKRKKVQGRGFQKKFRNDRGQSRLNKCGKVYGKNGI
ncbi:surfeit locus protein 2 [Cololabis saira]|uniref:surfeit locus protein 2 n=1 Tax=Cololabis saira TaxID=129043 RepID=UPI002AD52399|nr:surfeit locus protein 2 [Cololabis saira]